jgi:spermidine synthase
LTDWLHETLYTGYQQAVRIDKLLYEGRTSFQEVRLLENAHFGRVLVLDGVVQTTERDEFFYHEMMLHPALCALESAEEILIIGGGDGGCLREALRHPSIRKAVMVEIDGEVVELCKTYLPSLSAGAFDNPRAELIIGDGAKFIEETAPGRFDAIIIDSTDPQGPGEVLFSHRFYGQCARALKPRGVLITQNGVPFMQREELRQSLAHFAQHFSLSGFLRVSVPTYACGDMALGWASQETNLAQSDSRKLARYIESIRLRTDYYNPDIHLGAFAIPNYLKRLENS